MRRPLRSLIVLVAAYALFFGALFGAVASAQSAGSTHFALCLTGSQSGGDPVAPRDHGLCCLTCTGSGGVTPVLAPDETGAIATAPGGFSPWRSFAAELPSLLLYGSAAPRAPPTGA